MSVLSGVISSMTIRWWTVLALLKLHVQKKHKYSWKCHKGAPSSCPKCEDEKRIEDERKRKDFELELKRQERQREHARQLAKIQQQQEEQKRIVKEIAEEKERQNILSQQTRDLENLTKMAERAQHPQNPLPKSPSKTPNPYTTGARIPEEAQTKVPAQADSPGKPQIQPKQSTARDDWERQKKMEGQSNESLDALMGMAGLEEVKEKFLDIKAKVDTVVRQNTSLKDERFSAALLGNPGTGMCLFLKSCKCLRRDSNCQLG